MRISLRWLKQYLPIELNLSEIVNTLTMLGLEVEEATDLGFESKLLVVCEVLEIRPHPNADKLVLCTVKADDPEPIEVVCGARNMQPGDRVVLAKVGAALPPSEVHPEGLVLKAAQIRGVRSNGMLCSGPELTYNDDAAGIMILPPETPVGESFDALLEIKVTPNRPDCLSIIGVARELAAATKRKLSVPLPRLEEVAEKSESAVRIGVQAREECPRYTGRVVRDIQVGPSPLWLQRAVESAGLRSINNIVDVTNYVLIEMGHPLHAFDLEKIHQKQVIIRLANPGETMTTLDDQEITLEESDLLITDPKGPIALAGIMGGLDSEISESTTDVLLESAYFSPTGIRRTRTRLDKSTEASYRFERGADPKRLTLALERATELIHQVAGGKILKGTIDVLNSIPEPKPVWLRIERLNRFLGITLSGREIADMLVVLGFEILRTDREQLQVGVPSHRVDIAREADLFEEVARLLGYNKIPAALPRTVSRPEPPAPLRKLRDQIADFLVGGGYNEAILYSFTSEEALRTFDAPTDRLVRLQNPLSVEQSVMRTSLVPGIVNAVKRNHSFGELNVRLFELGKTYFMPEPPEDEEEAGEVPEAEQAEVPESRRKTKVPTDLPPPPVESTWLVAALTGGGKSAWNASSHDADFFDIKGLAESLLDHLGIRKGDIEEVTDVTYLHPGRAAAFVVQGRRLCQFGELAPDLAERFDLRRRFNLLEMNLDSILEADRQDPKFRGLPRYPAVERDLALVVDRDIPAVELERTMKSAEKQLLTTIRVFDLYEGDKIPEGKKSLAYSLTFRSDERTLTEDEVNDAISRILNALETKHSAALRTA